LFLFLNEPIEIENTKRTHIHKQVPQAENVFSKYGICLSDYKTSTLALSSPVGSGTIHAFGDKFWTPEDLTNGCLTVGFLDGSDQDHAIVKKKVREWIQNPDPIGIDFLFVDASEAQRANVRISFVRNNQSFSYVAKDCQTIPEGRETMHLGWDVSTPYGQATVLHEFGHALGLFHEHQSPFGASKKIHWVEEVVIEDCYRSQNWSPAETRAQIINVEPKTRSKRGTVYDPLSIMHYRFPPEWTEEGYDQPANLSLSSLDKTFIRQVYPSHNLRVASHDNRTPNPRAAAALIVRPQVPEKGIANIPGSADKKNAKKLPPGKPVRDTQTPADELKRNLMEPSKMALNFSAFTMGGPKEPWMK